MRKPSRTVSCTPAPRCASQQMIIQPVAAIKSMLSVIPAVRKQAYCIILQKRRKHHLLKLGCNRQGGSRGNETRRSGESRSSGSGHRGQRGRRRRRRPAAGRSARQSLAVGRRRRCGETSGCTRSCCRTCSWCGTFCRWAAARARKMLAGSVQKRGACGLCSITIACPSLGMQLRLSFASWQSQSSNAGGDL